MHGCLANLQNTWPDSGPGVCYLNVTTTSRCYNYMGAEDHDLDEEPIG